MKKFVVTREKPKIRIAWLVMVLGLASILEFPLLAIFSAFSSKPAATAFGPNIGIVGLALTVSALIIGIIAYRKGERSWVLWTGLIPAILTGAFWSLMIIAEIISIIFGLGI